MVRQWSLPNYFASKFKKNFAALLFFVTACSKKFQRANATDIAYDGNDPPDDWLKTGWARDSQTRTRLVDSLICITCSLENNAFSVLHYVMVALHYSMLHRFEIFSAPGTIAHGSIRLPPRSLASSPRCSLAMNIHFMRYISACFNLHGNCYSSNLIAPWRNFGS